jgi:hypothetical protein
MFIVKTFIQDNVSEAGLYFRHQVKRLFCSAQSTKLAPISGPFSLDPEMRPT